MKPVANGIYEWRDYLLIEKVHRLVHLAPAALREYNEIQKIEDQGEYHLRMKEWTEQWSQRIDNVGYDDDAGSSPRSISSPEAALQHGEV